ncbi:MAG: DUF6512 family protein [Faecousia sp.]
MKHEKLCFLFACLGAIIGGSALHFLYTALPHPLTALIAPVNESVWEHLKLLYYPTLLTAYLLSTCTMERQRLWSGFLIALLAMPLFLVGVYELLVCGFGVEGLLADIGLYVVTMVGGFALAYVFYRKGVALRATGVLTMLVIFYGAFLIVFSFAAPHFGIFLPPQ